MDIGLIAIALFILLILLRVPVYIALLTPAVLYSLLLGMPMITLSSKVARTFNSTAVLSVPLFIFLGSLMNHTDISEYIFSFLDDLFGHLSGGIAHVNIIASLIFSGMSGSALADIGGIGKILIKSMTDRGYTSEYSAGLTSASATVGPLFPPSIPLIIFGLLANTSVINLLLAGAFPAILATVALMALTLVLGQFRPFPTNDRRPSFRNLGKSFSIALPALLTPIVLIGGMLMGIFGPNSVAAIAIVYVAMISTIIYWSLGLEDIRKAGMETVQITTVVMITVGAASAFSWVLTLEGTSDTVANAVLLLSSNPIIILILVNVLLLMAGTILDPMSALVMFIPIVHPLLVDIGVHPVNIGVIMVFNLMLGLLTPPLGLSVFLSSDIAGAKPEDVFKDVTPYLLVLIVVLLIVTYYPPLTTWMV